MFQKVGRNYLNCWVGGLTGSFFAEPANRCSLAPLGYLSPDKASWPLEGERCAPWLVPWKSPMTEADWRKRLIEWLDTIYLDVQDITIGNHVFWEARYRS